MIYTNIRKKNKHSHFNSNDSDSLFNFFNSHNLFRTLVPASTLNILIYPPHFLRNLYPSSLSVNPVIEPHDPIIKTLAGCQFKRLIF